MRASFLRNLTLGSALRFIGGTVLIATFLWYVHFQARNLLGGPILTLDEVETLQHTRSLEVSGLAKNIVNISLNGREIFTDESGNFRERIVLGDGYNIVTLVAHDRFGRAVTVTREFVYVAPQ